MAGSQDLKYNVCAFCQSLASNAEHLLNVLKQNLIFFRKNGHFAKIVSDYLRH